MIQAESKGLNVPGEERKKEKQHNWAKGPSTKKAMEKALKTHTVIRLNIQLRLFSNFCMSNSLSVLH